jgi:EmrB/QacA subfamily drug resistance transporter
VLAVLCLTQVLIVLDSTVMNVALPSIQDDLGFGDADRQWIITGYALAFGSALLVGGRLSGIVGHRRMLVLATGGFVVASVVGGFAPGFPVLVAARAGQGLFAALLAPATLALMTTTFVGGKARAKAFGVFGGVSSSGSALGLLIGGGLADYTGWRWCLLVNVAVGAVVLVGARVLIPSQEAPSASSKAPSARRRLDVPGAATSFVGLIALVYGFSRAEQSGWTSVSTLAVLGGGVVALVLFVRIESRARDPLLPLEVVLDRTRGGAYLTVALAGVGMFGVFLFLAYHLQQVLSLSALATGAAFLPMVVSLVAMAIVSGGTLLPRFGPRVTTVAGFALAAVGTALLTLLTVDSGYATAILPGLIVVGTGFGLLFGPAMNLATDRVAPGQAGAASAMVNASQQIGAAVGTALLNTLAVGVTSAYVADHGAADAAQALLNGNRFAFWVTAGVFALGACICGLLVRPGGSLAASDEGEDRPA